MFASGRGGGGAGGDGLVRVKVCGVCRVEDAAWAVECGADVLGFVREPSSVRYCGDVGVVSAARRWAPWTPFVGVYGRFWGDGEAGVFDWVQSFDGSGESRRRWLKVYRPEPGVSVEHALADVGRLELVVLDAFVPGFAGGTGHVLDWGWAAEFVEGFGGKVVLAGGLGPGNVEEAVRRVRPFGVDASSGLESAPGVKDGDLVRAFVASAKGA